MEEKIIKYIRKTLNIEEKIELTVPKNPENGDLSSNIILKLVSKPNKTKEELFKLLEENVNNEPLINKIELAGPGFLNFYLNKSYLYDNIKEILVKKEKFGKIIKEKPIKINVEFVSANPTGLLHVGTSRGAAYGDNICRMLDFAGYDVTREYYFNDGGVQIDNLGISLKVRYKEFCGIKGDLPEDGYHGFEIVEIARELYQSEGNGKINESLDYFKEYATSKLIKIIKKDLEDFKVTFNVWTSEQDIRKSGKIEECLDILKKKGNIYENEGATWLKTTEYGDDKDRVIIKTDGNYTYLVPDIAYHLDKISRGYDEIIDVLGADHHGYIRRLKASVEALGYNKDKIDIKLLQMVRLLRAGKELKMSKRTGLTVTMRELMEEVGIDAARYFFAMRSLDTQMDFDMDLAVKKSNENPVYYVQYAHARICSILKKAKTGGINYSLEEEINIEKSDEILKKLNTFKNLIEISAEKKLPHMITNYLYDLATLFHSYYSNNKVICADIEKTKNNLKLIESIKIVMSIGLNLIGVSAPEKM